MVSSSVPRHTTSHPLQRSLLRPRPTSRPEEPTWAERLLPLLVVALPLLTGWAGAVLDNTYVVVDANYRPVTVYEGGWARNVRVLLLLAILAVAAQALITGVRRGRNPITWFTVAGAVVLVSVNLRGTMDPGELVAHAVALVALSAAAVSRIDAHSLRMVAWLAVAYSASNWLYFLSGASNASLACRPDKCSFLGVLLVGGSSHEQLLGLRMAFFVPALAFLTPRFRVPAVLFLLLTVLASGSRTAMAASLLSLVAFWLLTDAADARSGLFGIRKGQRALHQVLALAPLAGLALSLVLFLLVPRDALTSRGEIYGVVRSAVLESPLIGPGRGALQDAYEIGALTFSTPHEHSQAGYLLAIGGLVLFSLFAAGVVWLTQVAHRPGHVAVALFALAPAAAFVTEPIWTFDITDMGFGTLTLTTMLLATAAAHHRTRLGRRTRNGGRDGGPPHRARSHPGLGSRPAR